MQRALLIFLSGLIGGAALMASYHYFLDDHRALSRLKSDQPSTLAQAPLTSNKSAEALTAGTPPPLANPNATPLPESPFKSSPPEDDKRKKFASMFQNQMAQRLTEKLSVLTIRLNLTPEQAEKFKAFLEEEEKKMPARLFRFMAGGSPDEIEASATPGLEAILSPDQIAGYSNFKNEERKSNLEMFSTMEMGRAAPALGLSDPQRDQFYSAIYQVNASMLNPEWYKTNINPDNTSDQALILQRRNMAKANAVKEILTPAQQEQYLKRLEAQTERQKAFRETQTPNGTFSFGQ